MSGEPEESYRNVLQNDIMKMQEKIKDGIGKTPTTFTYPFGAVSPSTHKIIKEFGFKGTLSSAEGVSKISHNPQCLYMIKRYNRPYGTSSRNFFQKMLD